MPKRKRAAVKKKASSKAITAWCMRCQSNKKIKRGHQVIQMVNGRKMRKGECADCGTKTSTMVSKDTPADIIEEMPKEKKASGKRARKSEPAKKRKRRRSK